MRPIDSGWLVRTPELPLVWTLNQVHLRESPIVADAISLAYGHQSALTYRHIVVEDETTRELDRSFEDAGWRVDTEVVMALTEPADREVDTSSASQLSEEQMLDLMGQWIVEEHPDISAEGIEQVEEYNRREGRLWGERRYGAVDSVGSPLAVTKLRSDGTTAWVEDVYTVSRARGRGLARMLVTKAAAQAKAGHELTFIIADDNDWPKSLYAKIGFRPIGKMKTFHLDLGSRGGG